MITKKCLICGNSFISHKIHHRKYCSRKCYHKSALKHSMSRSSFYKIWASLKNRCFNFKNSRYRDYGGRGITVCDRWLKFENFRDDMYQSYKEHFKNNKFTSIERTSNNGNYCKENCRWATPQEQSNNMRRNHLLTYKGETLNITQWAKKINLNYFVIYSRLKLGWKIEKIFNSPIRKCKKM